MIESDPDAVASDVQSLNGTWEFRETVDEELNGVDGNGGSSESPIRPTVDEWLPATVPGDVYSDLLAGDVIDDPYVADNELDVQWVAETDWTYRRTFELPASLASHDTLRLECLGLDTVATVSLNGTPVIESENMHRKHAASVGDLLESGENTITVKFASPAEYAAEKKADAPYDVPLIRYPVDFPGRNFIRKAQCHFGWDWGPCLPGVGIWRDIRIVGYTAPRVDYVTTTQTHHEDGDVTLSVRAGVDAPTAGGYTFTAEIPDLDVDAERSVNLPSGTSEVELDIEVPDPDRWWPNGYGDQPLYDLAVAVGDGERQTTTTDRVGFREIELIREDDEYGQSFRFEVNGEPVFAKGANWIPADAMRGNIDDTDYDDLLGSAAAANMNMIRVWGGGFYELDAFYERCDELGLLVWQDFMFACALYPSTDTFVESVEQEARYQVRRLANHPSLALWCGNNENEMSLVSWFSDEEHIDELYADYERLNGALADVVAAEDDSRPFWSASPSSGAGEYDPYDETRGDLHFWDVWHEGAPFERYLEVEPRFVSEFGYQSFASVDLLREVIPEDQLNPTAPLMEHHQRHPDGNRHQLEQMADTFRIPFDFEDFVYLSQIQHGLAMRTAIEHWRRLPQCMGTLYWQLNDLWPCASWSSLEYGGDWKALHHFARRFYRPTLVSATHDEDAGDVTIWVTTDESTPQHGELSIEIVTLAGDTIESVSENVSLDANASEPVYTLSGDGVLAGADPATTMIRATFEGEATTDRTTEFLGPYKGLTLPEATVDLTVENGTVTIEAPPDAAALFVAVDTGELDVRLSDNYVHLLAGERRRLAVEGPDAGDVTDEELRTALSVQHLRETY